MSEFHTELELLPQEIIHKNEFIRHPLALEQYLMEGSYNKIFLAKGNVPSPNYNVFMDILLDTVRGEIAACLESSYDKISLKEAARRLNLKSEKEVADFGSKVCFENFFFFIWSAAIGFKWPAKVAEFWICFFLLFSFKKFLSIQ